MELWDWSNLSSRTVENYFFTPKALLADLAERSGGFNQEKDWDEILSLGEQQRLAFARILINKPSYVVLDEATSALDIKNESNLYQHLLNTNTTFVSVGHRPSLSKYHRLLLEMQSGEQWKLGKTNILDKK